MKFKKFKIDTKIIQFKINLDKNLCLSMINNIIF